MNEFLEVIIEAKEKMGDQAIDIIVSDLEIKDWDDSKQVGICPFHTKDGKPESTPSFKWNPKSNAFKCFGCGGHKQYGIVDHYKHMGLSSKQAYEKLFSEVGITYNMDGDKPRDYRFPIAETNTTMDKVEKYTKARKLSLNTLIECGVKQSKEGNIVFEYYDQFDELLMVKYRPAKKLKKGENKNWCQSNADTSHTLYGMNNVVFDTTLFITEGELDKLSCHEAGFTNSVSIPFGAGNFHWIEKNWDWLNNFEDIVICADNDEAGKKMLEEVIPRLGEWRCKTIKYPTNPNGKPINDVNEILFYYGIEGLQAVLASASDVPIKNVVNMSKIRDIDLSTALGVKTKISELDKRISKIFMSTLSIWTGVNGSGKSTAINQIVIAEAIDQGFKSFIFSGELSKEQVKNWIDYPLAGRGNIKEIKVSNDQPIFYKVKPDTQRKMEAWYDGKVWIYDDEIDMSAHAILDKMELLTRKHGVKVFLIDNLMTVNISKFQGSDKWDKQTQFVIALKEFAIKYKVAIHLVAHPRKLDMVKRLSKMDVGGAGDITNLAHYVFAIHRVTNAEKEGVKRANGEVVTPPIEYDTLLDCFKNRPLGTQDFTIGLYFDIKSKRFYRYDDDLYRDYGWVTGEKEEEFPQIIYDGEIGEIPL